MYPVFVAAIAILTLAKICVGFTRKFKAPKHYEYEELNEGLNGVYHSVMLQIKGSMNSVAVFSEPLFRSMGLKLDCIIITDPKLARETFVKSEKIQAHAELKGWFSTVYQWRRIMEKEGGDYMSENELGILRDIDHKDTKSTAIFSKGIYCFDS